MSEDEEFRKGYDQAVREIERHFAHTKRLDLALEIRKEWSIVWDPPKWLRGGGK